MVPGFAAITVASFLVNLRANPAVRWSRTPVLGLAAIFVPAVLQLAGVSVPVVRLRGGVDHGIVSNASWSSGLGAGACSCSRWAPALTVHRATVFASRPVGRLALRRLRAPHLRPGLATEADPARRYASDADAGEMRALSFGGVRECPAVAARRFSETMAGMNQRGGRSLARAAVWAPLIVRSSRCSATSRKRLTRAAVASHSPAARAREASSCAEAATSTLVSAPSGSGPVSRPRPRRRRHLATAPVDRRPRDDPSAGGRHRLPRHRRAAARQAGARHRGRGRVLALGRSLDRVLGRRPDGARRARRRRRPGGVPLLLARRLRAQRAVGRGGHGAPHCHGAEQRWTTEA